MSAPIQMHGITISPVFGGTIEVVDGVSVERANRFGSDRFYIAIGQPGFNSPTNNRGGYKSASAAAAACRKYASR